MSLRHLKIDPVKMNGNPFFTVVMTCLLLALHVYGDNDVPDPDLVRKLDPNQWNLKAELEREDFNRSEVILLTVVLTNKTESRMTLMESSFAEIHYYVRVFDAAGKEVPMTMDGRKTLNPSLVSGKYLPRVIGPKRSRTVQIDILKLFELREGQKYTMKVARFVDVWGEDKTKPVAIEFRIR